MSSSRVYIGRLPYRCAERDIERFFKGFGKIRDIMLKNGYCFVEFEDYRDAEDAVYDRNGQMLCGERVVVEHARGTPHGEDLRRDLERGIEYPPKRRGETRSFTEKSKSRGEYRLIVENLSTRLSWQDLKDLMRQAGEVTFTDAHRDRRNEGIVEFATRREMERAMDKFDGLELNGRRIRLIEVKGRSRRSMSRSPKRDSSRSRSRSVHGTSTGRRAVEMRKQSRSKSLDNKEEEEEEEGSRSPQRDLRSASRSHSRVARNGDEGMDELNDSRDD